MVTPSLVLFYVAATLVIGGGLGVVMTSISYRMWRWGLWRPTCFSPSPTMRLGAKYYEDAAGSSITSSEKAS